jgi:hypothetical protein
MTDDLTPKAQQTRCRILDTVLDLFASQGYAATTMRDSDGTAARRCRALPGGAGRVVRRNGESEFGRERVGRGCLRYARAVIGDQA